MKWNEMDFQDKLLFVWDRIDMYKKGNKEKDFWIYMLNIMFKEEEEKE